jgi:L-asparaginase
MLLLTNREGRAGVGTSADALGRGESALDAIEAGIKLVDLDPQARTVGYGGAPNILGEMELDGSAMCGRTLRTGAVGALKGYLHPFSVARQVMERLPHVMLVGDGAARFAGEIGAQTGELLSPEARADYERWLDEHVPPHRRENLKDGSLTDLVWPDDRFRPTGGTTVFLARASDGHWAGGVSTSGWAYKHPGRLGDSPVIGAGLYVDDRYGGAACTGTGEMTIRAGTARAVVIYMKQGATVMEACLEAVADLHALQGGYLGAVNIHAADRDGEHFVTGVNLKQDAHYWYWEEGMSAPESRPATPAE